MEWISTEINSTTREATVRWLNPSKDFLNACAYSALNQIVMPIGILGDGLQGYVIEYGWRHESIIDNVFPPSPTRNQVILTVRYRVMP